MHQLEYLRGSNTGKLLQLADPKTKMYICGQDNEKEMFELLKQRDSNRVMVLMPKDSVSIEEFATNAFTDPKDAQNILHSFKVDDEIHDGLDYLDNAEFFEEASNEPPSTTLPTNNNTTNTNNDNDNSDKNKHPQHPPISELPVVTVIILDGTWKQVKSLLNRLPEFTKVYILHDNMNYNSNNFTSIKLC